MRRPRRVNIRAVICIFQKGSLQSREKANTVMPLMTRGNEFFLGKSSLFCFQSHNHQTLFLLVALRSFILLFTFYDLFPCPLSCSSRSVKLQYTHRHSIFRKRHPFSFTDFHLLISTPLVYLPPVIFIFVCQHCIFQSIALLEFSMFLV